MLIEIINIIQYEYNVNNFSQRGAFIYKFLVFLFQYQIIILFFNIKTTKHYEKNWN